MAPAPQQQGGGDNSLAPLWAIAAIFVLVWIVWHFYHAQISTAILKLRLWEARLIALVIPSINTLVPYIQTLKGSEISFAELANISTSIGNYLRYPIAALMLVQAIVVYLSHVNLRFKKHYTMDSLVKTERDIWPQITPIATLDLVKIDIDVGPWAMALSPMQFAKKHRLLQKEQTAPTVATVIRPQVIAKVQREQAHHVFALQLGDYWQGVTRLPAHVKALFAVFAARAGRDKDGASKLLMQIAASTASGKLNFTGIEALLRKHSANKAVRRVVGSHAYVLTVMASMLVLARQDGVLASADFLWLKPTDRVLWFMLNSVGRQTAFSEVAGPFAHWIAERTLGRRLMIPMVDEAVNALEMAVKEMLYVPEDEED